MSVFVEHQCKADGETAAETGEKRPFVGNPSKGSQPRIGRLPLCRCNSSRMFAVAEAKAN